MKRFYYLTCLAFTLFTHYSITAQTIGCTDPFATNYNSGATQNDGSCLYPVTNIFPLFKGGMSGSIPESSGLVYTDGKLWTHNDSGNPASFFSIDSANGSTLQTVFVDNYPNVDWEDITADSSYIYLSDCGNNNGDRTDLKILKIKKSDIGNAPTVHVNAQAISVAYSDQTVFTSSSTHNFDCESIISIGNTLYLFTKDRGDLQTRVYRVPKTPGTYVISPYLNFNSNGLVCGADYDPVKKEVALVGYFKGHLNSFIWIFNDFKGDSFFSGNKRRIEIGDGTEWQTEGICYRSTGKLFISCEAAGQYNNSSLFTTDKTAWEHKSTSTGIEKIIPNVSFQFYPNPAYQSIHLTDQERILTVTVRNALGQVIFFEQVDNPSYDLQLTRFNFESGVHFIQVCTPLHTYSRPVLLEKP